MIGVRSASNSRARPRVSDRVEQTVSRRTQGSSQPDVSCSIPNMPLIEVTIQGIFAHNVSPRQNDQYSLISTHHSPSFSPSLQAILDYN